MRFVGLLIFSVAALGIASKAQAQADPNVQERANALTSTFNFKSTTADQSTTVCSPPKLPPLDHDKKAELLHRAHRDNIIKLPDDIINPPDVVVSAHRSVKAALLANKPRLDELIIVNERLLAVKYYPPNLCDAKQKTTVKLSALSNPDYETNVLKSKTNIQHDTSHAFGGNIEVTTGGFRDFDIMGVSIGSASARYDKFATKSLDVLNTQGIYQFFLGATADGGAKVIIEIHPQRSSCARFDHSQHIRTRLRESLELRAEFQNPNVESLHSSSHAHPPEHRTVWRRQYM
jgi:hypothetical protein